MKHTETLIFHGTWKKEHPTFTEYFVILGDPIKCEKYFMRPTKATQDVILDTCKNMNKPCCVEATYANCCTDRNGKKYWNKYLYEIKNMEN